MALNYIGKEETPREPGERDAVVRTFVFLPANYSCSVCGERAKSYVKAVNAVLGQESSTVTVVVDSSARKATHFANLQQFSVPAYQTRTDPPFVQGELKGGCYAVVVNANHKGKYLVVDLSTTPMNQTTEDKIYSIYGVLANSDTA